MLLTLALGGVAVGAVIYATHTRKDLVESREEYNKRCKELSGALEEVGKVKLRNISLIEDNEYLEKRIREYKHLMTSGGRNLKTHEWMVSLASQEPRAGISVIGQDTINSYLSFAVKDFNFNPNDPEDREFAIRQAEELIETIKNF